MSSFISRNNTYSKIEDLPTGLLYKVTNAFVISNLGQLKHVTGLIKKEKINDCFLLVIYTEANLSVPRAIHDSFDSSIFDKVLFFKLPNNPNSINFKNIKYIESSYRKIIHRISPSRLYLNSFQFHYAVLANISKQLGSSVILIEEGLGTYRLSNEECYENFNSIDSKLLRKISKETLSKTEIFKKLYKRYKMTREFATESKRFFRKFYLSPEVQCRIINFYPNSNLKSFYKPFLDFDEAYTSFPALTKDKFNVKKNNYYFSFEEPTIDERQYALSIIEKYNIKPEDYLYLSQKFNINRVEYLLIVKHSLLRLLEGNDSIVFVKLHPKQEHELVLQGFLEMEKETQGRIKVIEESGFLIEEVIKLSKVQGVIGITSSALVYSSLISSECKSYSIADTLVIKLIDHKRNEKGIAMIKDHTRILKQFENIQFI
ncbi:alpha-2,8-polysialyltransferase family protein [Psychrobacter piscatorii]|uniref:alpha-2,8-polysialyltransferase family protein n=1 Tax=Psychrobacter piscatorii TaxID=554343 RepID=UPI003736AFAA